MILPQGREWGWDTFWLHYPEGGWQAAISGLFEGKWPVADYQQYFVFRHPTLDRRRDLPVSFEMAPVSAELLGRDDLANIRLVRRWAEGNFGSRPAFLENGFGFCVTHGSEIASWCISDCVSGHRAEIGIHTPAAYRRRGLASCAVAAAIEHCLSRGITEVGWHCWNSNLASAATARAVGFEKVLDHYGIQLWLNEFDGLLVNGNLRLLRGEYAEAADWYRRAFAQVESGAADAANSGLMTSGIESGRYYYKAACASALSGDRCAATGYLEKAFEAGTDRWLLH